VPAARLGTVSPVTEQRQAGSPAAPRGAADSSDSAGFPGQDLGLPESGPGSMASQARRVAALFIDWLLCALVVVAAFRAPYWQVQYWTLLVFVVQDIVLTGLIGITVGKRLLGLRVVRLDGRAIGLGWALVRTALILTIVPPLMQDHDLRGQHDRASNTAVVRI
jgi:uncharacterized RDD family membrane protein YckC